jgi:outer membrane immunogenic protein
VHCLSISAGTTEVSRRHLPTTWNIPFAPIQHDAFWIIWHGLEYRDGAGGMRPQTTALAIAATCVAIPTANSADLPVYPAPAPATASVAFNPVRADPWTGFYSGGNFGYGWANANSNLTLAGNAFSNGPLSGNGANLDGVNGGLQAGYNWQTGYFLVGVEGDIQAADQNQTSTYSCGLACSVTETAKIDWFGTIRGRAGIAYKDVLFYGTGGANWTDGEHNFSGTLGGASASLANFTHDSFGWVAGGGIEWMFAWGWSAKIEYLYLENTNSNFTISVPAGVGGGTLTDTAKASNNVVRIGLNYHFYPPYGGGWPYNH